MSDDDKAQSSEPASRMSAEATRTGLRPLMSASRPATGMATPPARRVAVTTHAALSGAVSSSRGSSGWTGITSDCMSEAHMLEKPRTRMTAVGAVARSRVKFISSFRERC